MSFLDNSLVTKKVLDTRRQEVGRLYRIKH